MEYNLVSLADYSSLHVGGDGLLCTVTSVSQLQEAFSYARKEGKVVHILGGGTNTYFGQDLSKYLFVKLCLSGIEFRLTSSGCEVKAFAGEVWDDLVSQAVSHGFWGIENLSLIPGTVGAAPVQNIGAYGVEFADSFVSLEAYDTHSDIFVVLDKEACQFGYRMSLFKHDTERYVITAVTLALSSVAHPKLTYKPLDALLAREVLTPLDVRQAVIDVRRAKLPDWKEYANAGSFFKNPTVSREEGESLRVQHTNIALHEVEGGYKISAAWLIEHVAHMKGVKVGDLRTWDKQPLVIVNEGAASADDVDAFAGSIRGAIFEATGITLEQEVNRIG